MYWRDKGCHCRNMQPRILEVRSYGKNRECPISNAWTTEVPPSAANPFLQCGRNPPVQHETCRYPNSIVVHALVQGDNRNLMADYAITPQLLYFCVMSVCKSRSPILLRTPPALMPNTRRIDLMMHLRLIRRIVK